MAGTSLPPNLYELAGGGSTITYATTGIRGRASLQFSNSDLDVRAEGTDIRTKKTDLGTMVSVEVIDVADGPSTMLTLLLPVVNMAGEREQKLRTVAILTTTANTLAGPSLVKGQLQRYKSISVRGTARRVDS